MSSAIKPGIDHRISGTNHSEFFLGTTLNHSVPFAGMSSSSANSGICNDKSREQDEQRGQDDQAVIADRVLGEQKQRDEQAPEGSKSDGDSQDKENGPGSTDEANSLEDEPANGDNAFHDKEQNGDRFVNKGRYNCVSELSTALANRTTGCSQDELLPESAKFTGPKLKVVYDVEYRAPD